MTTISAAIIALNEEEDLEDCLKSLYWVDEIIVVDALSADRTVEIARKYTDKVYLNKWPGFAAQKNFAFSKASAAWVLSLDADERVPEELKEEIIQVIHRPDALDGYYLSRKNYWLGKWIRYGGWYPDYTLRLFRRGKAECRYQVHERIVVEGQTGFLKSDLLHYNIKSIDDHMFTLLRATTLEAQEAIKNQVRFYWFIPFKPLTRLALRFLKGPRTIFSLRLLAKELLKNKVEVVWLIPFKPVIKFVAMFIIRQGFRDGRYGFFAAVLSTIYVVIKYAKIWELKRKCT